MDNKIILKLFAGVLLNAEMKLKLRQSEKWQQATILPHRDETELIEVHHEGKDYLGYYLPNNQITLSELRNTEKFIQERMIHYHPDFALINHKTLVFTQVFIC